MDNELTSILEDVKSHLKQYVAFTEEAQADVLAAWVVHTHVIDAFHSTPYIYITSNGPGAGKTRLMEVLEGICYNSERLLMPTPATVFTMIEDMDHPTLLFDEIDTIYNTGSGNEQLRGVLNGGYRKGNTIPRRFKGEIQKFHTFCPKVFAGIDNGLPATLKDRSIVIRLEKRKPGQFIDRYIYRDVAGECRRITQRISDWAVYAKGNLEKLRPPHLPSLDDRAIEISEPLLAIYEVAGGEWTTYGRVAVEKLLTGRNIEDPAVALLSQIRDIFTGQGEDRLRTRELLLLLGKTNWTGRDLAERLKRFKVKPRTIRFDDSERVEKGYRLADFEDAFDDNLISQDD